MRLVDVDDLGVGRCSKDVLPAAYCAGWNGLLGLIEKAPTVDAVPVVHGAWQVTDRFKACSVCGYAFARLLPDKYCPNCGAMMDGGADHEAD